MKRIITIAGIIAMTAIIGLTLTGCEGLLDEDSSSSGSKPNNKSGTPRYETVPYTSASAGRAAGLDDKLIYSAYDNDNNYYLFLLGHINNVPVAYRTAVEYNGVTPITIEYSKAEATEDSITKSSTVAIENSVTDTMKHSWELSVEIGFKVAGVGQKIIPKVGGEYGKETTEARSFSDSYETTMSKLSTEQDTISATIGTNGEPAGKYRYTYFGTSDIYYVLITDRAKTERVKGYYAVCTRSESFRWAIDYEPDLKGSFGKTAGGDLLGLPALLTLNDLPDPEDDVEPGIIPTEQKAATPVASLASGAYIDAQSVTLSGGTTPGAVIYYTVTGVTPTAASIKYTGNPIPIGTTTTLKAVSIAEGFLDSDIMTETYTISKTKWSQTLTSNHKITDATYRAEYFTSDFNLSGLQAAGYRSFSVQVEFMVQEIDDGYVHLFVAPGTQDGLRMWKREVTLWWDKDWDLPNKNWNTYTETFSVPISSYTNGFTLMWTASGQGSDDFNLSTRTVTVTVNQ